MADIGKYIPLLLKLEGGFVDDPADKGGVTNMGVTLSSWRQMGYDKNGDGDIDAEDIRHLTHEDVAVLLKAHYWDRWHGDDIRDQKLANILVDWLWCSGKWGILIPQRVLHVTPDGIAGTQTLSAVNRAEPISLLISIYNARLAFIQDLIRRDPAGKRFEQGWINRINSLL